MNLRPLWNELLSGYAEIAKICNRHHLRYWAAWGTALGAVRHKGFIPWDDDFDLFMPREDYERFLDIADQELPPHLRTVSLRNTRHYPFMFAKVQDVRADVSDRIKRETGHPQNEGIYIDIFPLDGIKAQTWLDRLIAYHLRVRRNLVVHSSVGTTAAKIGRLGAWLLYWVPGPRTEGKFAVYLQQRACRIPFDKADYVGYMELAKCGYAKRESFRREWFAATKRMPFEGVEVPIPSGVFEILTTRYGNWQQLPPEEDRVWKHRDDPVAPWRYGPVTE